MEGEWESGHAAEAKRRLKIEPGKGDSFKEEAKASPLPHVVRLQSDAGEDITSWYAETFSNELSEVKKSIKLASNRVKNIHQSPKLDQEESAEDEDYESSVSSSMATKLEIALMQAKEEMESQTQQKEYLETRLACLEELEELRMKLSSLELQKLLESKAESTAIVPPVWDRDEDNPKCFKCRQIFSFTVRRHHCRRCGHVFCESCAPKNNVTPIPALGYYTPVRHCFQCLPPADKREETFAVSSESKQPLTNAIDAIRRMENSCLKTPSADALLATLDSYVLAIEKITKSSNLSDAHFRKSAHSILLRSMHAFLQMPQVQKYLRESEGTGRKAKAVISSISTDLAA